jgi:endogenous inhibitor of DNA gyrase (YacG/DUF329 family)
MSETRSFGRCPVCGQPGQVETRPFCSRRCADIDLGRWFGGRYVVSRPDPNAEAEDLPRPNGAADSGRDGGI